MKHRKSAALFAMADWNLDADGVAKIAADIGGELVVGRGVDHAIGRGVKLRKVMRLGNHGSDHEALLYVFEVDGFEVRVLWWNVCVEQTPTAVVREVAMMTDRHQPHVIGLCEAYRIRAMIGQLPGYWRIQGRKPRQRRNSEASEIAVLVRRDSTVIRSGWLRMREPWTGPKLSLQHGPRRYVRARVRFKNGPVLRVLAAHLPTGGHGKNPAAVRESIARITDWAGR